MTKKEQPAKSLDAFADERAQVKFSEHEDLTRQLRAAKASAREQAEQVRDLTTKLGLFERMDTIRPDPPTWLVPKTPAGAHPAIPTLLVTDVHWDEVVRPEQIDGINAYNRRIAEARLQRGFEGAITTCRDRFKGYSYEGFVVALGGDVLSGLIHEELRETNEAAIMESVLGVLDPLEAGLRLLAKEFGHVDVEAVVGNHGRRTQKPVFKNRAQDNFDWLVYKIIERDFRGSKNIAVRVSDAMDAQYALYSTRYLLTHGDQFKGGSGISAALAPLMLGSHRKTKRQAAAGKPYDIMVMGHLHQKLSLEDKGLIVGPCPKGFDEYAYGNNFDPSPPAFALWLTTPTGVTTGVQSILVQDRAAENW